MAEVRIVSFGSPEHAATLALRTVVMRRPDEPAFTPEEIGEEADDMHFALVENGEVRASLVLSVIRGGLIQMRQVAVHPDLRRQGLGRQLVAAAEAHARANGFWTIVFYARPEAVAFYEALGYVHGASWFAEVGVPEQMMAKRL